MRPCSPCLFDRDTEGAIVKRFRTTNIEGEYLVESDNPDKGRYPTMIWKGQADGDAQGFDLIGRVIWAGHGFKRVTNGA